MFTSSGDCLERLQKYNCAFGELLKEIIAFLIQGNNPLDCYLLYLKALLLDELGEHTNTIDLCLQSLKVNPLNWECWMLLTSLVNSYTQLKTLIIPALSVDAPCGISYLMYHIFLAKLLLKINDAPPDLLRNTLHQLQKELPNFILVDFMVAEEKYNLRGISFGHNSYLCLQILMAPNNYSKGLSAILVIFFIWMPVRCSQIFTM